MANKKFSEFELKTTTSSISHIVGYSGAENCRISPANFVTTGGTGVFLPLAGGTMTGALVVDSTATINDILTAGLGLAITGGTVGSGKLVLASTNKVHLSGGSAGLVLQNTSGTNSLTIDTNSTFTGDVEIMSGNKLILQRPNNAVATEISTDSTGAMILNSINDEGFFFNNNGTNAFKLDPINATFAGSISAVGIQSSTFIEATTRLFTGNGSVGAPSISFASDQNTGIFRAGSDIIGFTAGGSEKMRLSSGGDLGIGTAAPSEKLEVQDGNIKIETTTNLDAKLILNPYSGGLGTSYQWNIDGRGSAGNYAFQISEGTTPYLTIGNSAGGGGGNTTFAGNVNIIKTGDAVLTLAGDGISNSGGQLKGFNNGFGFTVAPDGGGTYVEAMRLNGAGNLGLGTSAPTDTLTISNDNNLLLGLNSSAENDAQLRFYSSGNYKNIIYRPANSNDLRFNTSTSGDVLTIQQDGNVGIGTTSPDSKLEIFDSTISTDPTALDSNFLLLTNGEANEPNETWGVGFNTNNSGANKLGAYVHAIGNYSANFNTSLAFGTRGVTAGTNAVERMRLDSAGNLGLGTAAPISLSSNTQSLTINSTRTDLTGGMYLSANGTNKFQSYWDSQGHVNVTIAGDDRFFLGGSEKMRLNSVGRLLLGTSTADEYMLNVNTTALGNNVNAACAAFGNDLGTTQSRDSWLLMRASAGTDDRSWSFGAQQAGDFRFNYLGTRATAPTTGSNFLTIKNTGLVGIGTISPTAKISISGSQNAIDFGRGLGGDSKWGFSSDSSKFYIAELSTGSTDYVMNIQETTGNVDIVKGDVTITTADKGLVLKSANGTQYKITVADNGTVTSTAV